MEGFQGPKKGFPSFFLIFFLSQTSLFIGATMEEGPKDKEWKGQKTRKDMAMGAGSHPWKPAGGTRDVLPRLTVWFLRHRGRGACGEGSMNSSSHLIYFFSLSFLWPSNGLMKGWDGLKY